MPPSPAANPLADLWAAALDLVVVLALATFVLDRFTPPQHLPWKPLRLSDPIGSATGVKLARIALDPALCRRTLAEGGVRFQEARTTRSGEFCSVENAVRLTGGTTPLRPAGPVMRCPLALGYALWDRQVLQPAAREIVGAAPVAVEHYGTYACRRVYGSATGRVSEHASANALDVASVRFPRGRRASVLADYNADTPAGRLLRRAREGGCDAFRVVLSPDYNAAHRDHFHFDQGPFSACR